MNKETGLIELFFDSDIFIGNQFGNNSPRKCHNMFIPESKKFFNSFLVVIVILITSSLPAAEQAEQLIPEHTNPKNPPFTIFQFSFFAPLQIFSENDNVYGLRLTLPHGENDTLVGMDLGISNNLHNLYGISFAAFLSQRSENMYGMNVAGFFNISQGNDVGLSMAGFYNEINKIEGVQTAILYNQAKVVNGVQLGLVNFCHDMKGAQIGIFNVCKAQPFPFTLLFNFWK